MARSKATPSSRSKKTSGSSSNSNASPSGGGDKKKPDPAAAAAAAKKSKGPSAPQTVHLLGPSQSPRDPNLYSVIRCANGIRIALNCTCSFSAEQVANCEKIETKKTKETDRAKATTTGARSKCKRTVSDYDTPRNKRSRANKHGDQFKDLNCVDLKVVEFNKNLLHICENDEDGCTNTGVVGFSFTCCGLLGDKEGNNSVEGEGKPLPDPEELVANPEEPPVAVEPSAAAAAAAEEDDEVEPELKKNPWNRENPDITGETNLNCSKGAKSGLNNRCSIAITVPWGPIFDPDDCPGASEIGANCIQGPGPMPTRDEDTTTFVYYMEPSKINAAIQLMSDKFHPAMLDKEKESALVDSIKKVGTTLSEKLRTKCWNYGHLNILKSPKRIKLLSTFAKPDHPVRRCALGGKLNKHISELPAGAIQRALGDVVRNNCKPQYMTVAIGAPESLQKLEELMVVPFGSIGNISGGKQQDDVHTILGDPDPFDTPEFRRFYKILSCPGPEACPRQCSEHFLILAFALPSPAWRNYKTKPLDYLSHVIGHHGIGGLNTYLKKKNLISKMNAECSKTPLHRNQFVSMFEISFTLTEIGFNEYENVLEAAFSYLKLLASHGPQRHIYKELQRIQAIKFHSLGTRLQDLTLSRDAHCLSKSLQIAVSADIVLAPKLMLDYNGPLLSEYMNLLTPQNANIMLVSNAFKPETMTELEPFLITKYSVEEIREDLLHKLTNGSIDSAFKLPQRNMFIPESFCTLKLPEEEEPIKTDADATPIHVRGDDYHDLWYHRDVRYKSRTGCVIHFVAPISLDDIDCAVKMTLFYTIFKRLAVETLANAKLAYASYSIKRTHFGILVRVESNADKVGQIVGALATLLTTLEDEISEEYFALKKSMFRQQICCDLKAPVKLGRDLERVISHLHSWPTSDYIPIIDEFTRDGFVEFLNEMRRDLYYLLLVVGNARIDDAKALSDSINDALALRPVISKKIEEIKIMQWPVGSTFIQVHGLDPVNPRDFISCHYQIGLATSQEIVLSKLIEPMLQEHFSTDSDLIDDGIFVLVGSTQKHNVIEIYLQAYFTTSEKQTPEDVEERISSHLANFYNEELCSLKPKALENLKNKYLCGCDPKCSWFSTGSDLSTYTQCILNLNMSYIGNEAQKCACCGIKVKDVQEWFKNHFIPDDSDCDSECRQITVIVVGNLPPEVVKSVYDDPDAVKKATTKKSKRDAKKGSCSSKTCAELMKGVSRIDLTFDNPNVEHCDENGKIIKKKVSNGKTYVTDLEDFKGNLYIYPSIIPT